MVTSQRTGYGVWLVLAALVLTTGMLVVALKSGGPPALADTPSGECFGAEGTTIIVDPGHGGSDPGAVNGTYALRESELNLEISEMLRDQLVSAGYQVCMTRTVEDTLTNRDRYDFANAKNGDALVSIHLNSSTDQNADYTMTMYGKRKKDLAFAETVLPFLYEELTQPSAAFGEDNPLSSSRTDNFASGVLLKSDMPAIIVEAVFMSNSWEARALAGDEWTYESTRQEQIATAVFKGVESFLSGEDSDGGNGDDDDDGDDSPGGGPPPGKGNPHG